MSEDLVTIPLSRYEDLKSVKVDYDKLISSKDKFVIWDTSGNKRLTLKTKDETVRKLTSIIDSANKDFEESNKLKEELQREVLDKSSCIETLESKLEELKAFTKGYSKNLLEARQTNVYSDKKITDMAIIIQDLRGEIEVSKKEALIKDKIILNNLTTCDLKLKAQKRRSSKILYTTIGFWVFVVLFILSTTLK
jgi:GTPase SAR1 family protein